MSDKEGDDDDKKLSLKLLDDLHPTVPVSVVVRGLRFSSGYPDGRFPSRGLGKHPHFGVVSGQMGAGGGECRRASESSAR